MTDEGTDREVDLPVDLDLGIDPRIRAGILLALVVYLVLSVWAATSRDPVATLLADSVFVVAIIAFGLYVRVVQAGDEMLLRVTGSLFVGSGLAQAYLMLNPEGPITPAVPNLLVVGGGVLYVWTTAGKGRAGG